MNNKLDWVCVALTPISAAILCVLTYAWADKLSNGLLALGTVATFCLGLCMKTAGERLLIAELEEIERDLRETEKETL